ncbi:hypothetical protein [Actinomadura sp. 3N407]|uniref:hypothetical protein n=1 Tax=Actinomadura sp. 3N407 TaxID=3457423 RepID=UPI003FCD594B
MDMLRTRTSRREEPLEQHLPEPLVTEDGADPEQQALLADAVGLAMLIVLDTLTPAERLAEQALAFSSRTEYARPALVNGAAGLVVAANGRPIAVMAFTVADERIAELDIYADPQRLNQLDPAIFNGTAKDPSRKP